jgi:hypothetical protein
MVARLTMALILLALLPIAACGACCVGSWALTQLLLHAWTLLSSSTT